MNLLEKLLDHLHIEVVTPGGFSQQFEVASRYNPFLSDRGDTLSGAKRVWLFVEIRVCSQLLFHHTRHIHLYFVYLKAYYFNTGSLLFERSPKILYIFRGYWASTGVYWKQFFESIGELDSWGSVNNPQLAGLLRQVVAACSASWSNRTLLMLSPSPFTSRPTHGALFRNSSPSTSAVGFEPTRKYFSSNQGVFPLKRHSCDMSI